MIRDLRARGEVDHVRRKTDFAREPVARLCVHLLARGLSNHWGYNPINVFSPEPAYAAATGGKDPSHAEQAAAVLVRLGVKAVIAPSFSGLFFRNAFNLGLLLLNCSQAEQLQEAEHIALDLTGPQIVASDGSRLACDSIPEFLLEMVRSGGLINQLRMRYGKEIRQV